MNEQNKMPVNTRRSPRRRRKKMVWRIVRRTLLALFTVVVVLVAALAMVLDLVFNGPSETARNVLTMSLLEASATKWVPALFIGQDTVTQIREEQGQELPDDISTPGQIQINTGSAISGSASDEWKDYPDGIRIESIAGDSYNAHVMIIRDPSKVYMATSSDRFSKDIPGTRINEQIEIEGAIAAINAGAFYDNGTSSITVGSVPEGLVIAGGKVLWESGSPPAEIENGFVGFNQDNVLVVAKSMTGSKAMELGIRDGCMFGPVLIMNGTVNDAAYNSESGYNPRTAIGQRADGAVIFLCIDGRQAGSLGGTFADVINIMVEYGAVNACNLDGGSSTVMLYRDQYGRYGDDRKFWDSDITMINNYSLFQEDPRRMPTFFMVAPSGEE